MKSFLLDKHPNFGEEKVSIEGNTYSLRSVKNNGCYLTVTNTATGIERDHICFSRPDLRAIYLLLSTEK